MHQDNLQIYKSGTKTNITYLYLWQAALVALDKKMYLGLAILDTKMYPGQAALEKKMYLRQPALGTKM